MAKVIVVGAGPAGMMAAWAASEKGHQVTLLEKNKQVGKKLRITGNGRCNVTNSADKEAFLSHIVSNPRFLYSSVSTFSNQDMIHFLNQNGIRTKEEDSGRIFPVSNQAMDIVLCMLKVLNQNHVSLCTEEQVQQLIIDNKTVKGVLTNKGKRYADVVILTTGGKACPVTGSTGDGYTLARLAGHTITPLYPALTSIKTKEHLDIQGLALSHVHYVVKDAKQKKIYASTGDLLFTNKGISGPGILTASSYIVKKQKSAPFTIHIDLCYKMDLEPQLLHLFQGHPNKKIINVLHAFYPHRLIPILLKQAYIDENAWVHDITRKQRQRLIVTSHDFILTLLPIQDFDQAMVTSGGIAVKEIDPATMSSKKVSGLKFAGEIIDVDGITGGYNLQIAWSTGYTAGHTI